MGILLVFGIGITMILWAVVSASSSSNKTENTSNRIDMYLASNSINSQEFPLKNNQVMMAVDTESKKLFYCKRIIYYKKSNYETGITIIDINDLLSIEVVEDDIAVQSVSKGQALTGAVLGGAIAGGVGAVIGSNTASSSLKRKVKNITLRFKLNSMTSPYKEAVVFKSSNGVMSDDYKFKKEYENILNFVARIELLMKD